MGVFLIIKQVLPKIKCTETNRHRVENNVFDLKHPCPGLDTLWSWCTKIDSK